MKAPNYSPEMPKISVIVPFYNVERYARQCIESIQGQTYENIEIILVDDGSPDNCGKICDEYAASDNRIKVLHTPNGGLSAARNAGLDAATGDYIGFVDSDDWIEPEMYERMFTALNKTHSEIAICNITYDYIGSSIPERHRITSDIEMSRDEILKILMDGKYLKNYAVNKLYKRSVITNYFPVSQTFEDVYVAIRWFSNASKVCFIEFEGYHYRQRKGSIMHEINPGKNIQYLVSRVAQLEYIKEVGLLETEIPKYEIKLVHDCIREAKVMARSVPANNEYYEGIRKIHELIAPYKNNLLYLNKKYQSHYRQLSNPTRFYWRMRIGNLFHLKKKAILPNESEFFD